MVAQYNDLKTYINIVEVFYLLIPSPKSKCTNKCKVYKMLYFSIIGENLKSTCHLSPSIPDYINLIFKSNKSSQCYHVTNVTYPNDSYLMNYF